MQRQAAKKPISTEYRRWLAAPWLASHARATRALTVFVAER